MTDTATIGQPFWDAVARDTLAMQRCTVDGHIRFPVSEVCPRCLSEDHEWVPLSGLGTVLSKVTFHRAYKPEWADHVPYDVLFVQLDEGPRMFSGPAVDARGLLQIGDRVEVRFEQTPGGNRVPVFTIREESKQ